MTDTSKPESVKLDEFKKNFMSKTENDSKLKLKKDKRAIAPLPPLQKKQPKRGEGLKFKAKSERVELRGGGICKKGMNRKAIGKNS